LFNNIYGAAYVMSPAFMLMARAPKYFRRTSRLVGVVASWTTRASTCSRLFFAATGLK
jgi:hypothetical protein